MSNVERAAVFAALGDPTRLDLIAKLNGGESLSLSQLSSNSELTRQAVSKHLRVLESKRLVVSQRIGRETRYRFSPANLDDLGIFLDEITQHWEDALTRLQHHLSK